MNAPRKVVVPSALAVLLEVMRDQEKRSPELAGKQRRLEAIIPRRKMPS